MWMAINLFLSVQGKNASEKAENVKVENSSAILWRENELKSKKDQESIVWVQQPSTTLSRRSSALKYATLQVVGYNNCTYIRPRKRTPQKQTLSVLLIFVMISRFLYYCSPRISKWKATACKRRLLPVLTFPNTSGLSKHSNISVFSPKRKLDTLDVVWAQE